MFNNSQIQRHIYINIQYYNSVISLMSLVAYIKPLKYRMCDVFLIFFVG